jgi:hypothetical protein
MIGSTQVEGQEFPDRTIYTDETTGNMYFVPFVADDGRVGYRIGWAVKADEDERAGREAFVYFNPSTSVDMDVAPDVFIYTGIENDPAEDAPIVFVALDDETLGISE